MKITRRQIRKIIREAAQHQFLTEGMRYHLDNGVGIDQNIYRPGSSAFFKLFTEARNLYYSGKYSPRSAFEKELIEGSIGEYGYHMGELVPLEYPMLNESLDEAEYEGRDVDLNSPMRSSGPKKYKVYVKNKKGNVIKVDFGDAKGGLSSKIGDPQARANFRDRHNCPEKNDNTKPGYWSCRLPRYAEKLGLKKVSAQWW